MKINRQASFAILTLVYLLAAAVGIVTYRFLSGATWWKLLVADVVATVVTFVFSLIFGNASVYDPYWSVQPLVIVWAFAFVSDFGWTKVLLLFAVTLWGIRLTANWAYTFHGMAHQDWRYTMLKEKTGAFYPLINFVGIHLVPTLVVYACTLPAVFALQNASGFAPLCLIGFFLSVGAVVLQSVADIQMQKYRKARKTPFIRTGVWKYSRHPNYLAEILFWWGVAAFAIFALGFQWYYLVGAAANTLLFLCVSIPLADGRQSKKEGFQDYKAETRMLLPIPKKRKKEA